MVRTYKKKTARGSIDIEIYKRAANDVKDGKLSLRKAAKAHNINFMTLQRFLKRKQKYDEGFTSQTQFVGYVRHRQIFSEALEAKLVEYIIHCSRIYYGLTPKDFRTLAYEYAVACNVKYLQKWNETKRATEDWLLSFLKRHPKLSLRTPEATSLARATSFNAHNVGQFYDNLDELFKRHKFEGHQVWNVDETGVSTVQIPSKIIAEKGKKQVGRTTSAEKGTTVTMEMAVNAIGNSVPPLFIFPRVHFKPHFIRQGPPGCIGVAHPSGWITAQIFLQFMEHFYKHVLPSVESPVLLILDNHISHLSLSVLDFCKEKGIILLSFPPHTSHRLQPLDLSIYGPFKKYYYTSCSDWMNSHPGTPITIYDIPGNAKQALSSALTPKNIMAGFEKAGIWPFNRYVYTEQDFLTANLTDRAVPETEIILPVENEVASSSQAQDQPLPQTELILPVENEVAPSSQAQDQPSTSGTTKTCIVRTPKTNVANEKERKEVTPEDVRPYPKAAARKNKRERKKGKSAILTDTPVKEDLRKEEIARIERKKKKEAGAKKKLLMGSAKTSKETLKKKKSKQESELSSESENDEDCLCIICLKPYSQSKTGEGWIQCIECKQWAHERCGGDDSFYVCVHCLSDTPNISDSEED